LRSPAHGRDGWGADVAYELVPAKMWPMPRHPREMQLHPTRDRVTLDFYSASAPGTRGVSGHLPSFLDLLPPCHSRDSVLYTEFQG
jgi:hypothetical protein